MISALIDSADRSKPLRTNTENRQAGADIKSAQRILGHSKASHTLDIYADFVPDRVDAAMERLEAAIEEA